MKLRSVLSLQPVENLQQIAESANIALDPHSNKTALIDLLCRLLPVPAQVATQLKGLNSKQRNSITTLAAEGGELLKSDAIKELSGGSVNRFQSLLKTFSKVGLAFQDNETLGTKHPLVGIPDSLMKSIPVPETQRGRLRTVMKSTSLGLLRAFARELEIPVQDSQRPFVTQSVRAYLLNPKHLSSYLNRLSEERRAIFNLLLKEKEVTREELQKRLGESTAREFEEILWRTPLFFSAEHNRSRKFSANRLASDLHRTLQNLAIVRGGHLEISPEEVLEGAYEDPVTIQDNTPYILKNLTTLLGLINRKHPQLLKRGGISKVDLREAGRFCLGETDPSYPGFLILFAETAGIVHPENQHLIIKENTGDRLEQVAQIRKALFTFWQETDQWNEWTVDRSVAAGRRSRTSELKSIRQEILKTLRKCPKHQWISYPKFYRLLTRSSELFRNFSENPGTGRTLATRNTTADELLRRILRAALTWTGLIKLGNPKSFSLPLHRSEKATFQLTSSGLALLGEEISENIPELISKTNLKAQFIIQPNFEILSPPDLPYGCYITLCSLTDLESIDVMSRFRITREAFQKAMNRGTSGSSIREFFLENSTTDIPEIVEALIQECEAKYGEIQIEPTSGYLTVVESPLLDELYAQKQIAIHLGPRLSCKAAALALDTKPNAFFELLHKQGYMPHLAHNTEVTKEGHHKIVLNSTELSELVGFLETSVGMLSEKTSASLKEINPLVQRFRRSLRQVSDKHREEAIFRYKKNFDKLFQVIPLNNSLPALLDYPGKNPTTCQTEIRSLVEYAIDYKLCIEIKYGSQKTDRRIVEPFSSDHAMIYAFCRNRKNDRVFRLNKILFARLTGEPFQRN